MRVEARRKEARMIHRIRDQRPDVSKAAFIAWNAEVAGNVTLGEDVSVWFGATLRGDIAPIRIGNRSNIQDGTVVHVDAGQPVTVGEDVTVGHRVILHSCTVGNGALIGMGAILLNGAEIGEQCLVGAGALVTANKRFAPRTLVLGSPAKEIRPLTDEELEDMKHNSAAYVVHAREAATEYAED